MYTNYDFFDELLTLRNTMDRFFSDIPSTSRTADYPYVNLAENDDSVVINAIMPGVEAGDLDIQLVNNSLIIAGERKTDYADQPYIRRERDFGMFRKSIRLPYRMDRDRIEASMKDGILTIRLYKSPEALPRKIEIQ